MNETTGTTSDPSAASGQVAASGSGAASGPSRLLQNALGRKVKLTFFDEAEDADLYNVVCTITGFEGSWMKVKAETKGGPIEKSVPISSVLFIEFAKEA